MRRWQGRDRNRLRRERPFQSRQRTVSRASVDIQTVPATASLVLTSFIPVVATPVNVVPGKTSLVLTEFASVVATPRVVTPAKLSLLLATSAPAIATPRAAVPGKLTLSLATFAPAINSTANLLTIPAAAALTLKTYSPAVQGDPVVSTDASGSGKAEIFYDSDHFPGPSWKPQEFTDLPDDPLPGEAPRAKQLFVDLNPDNAVAFIALFEDGALTEDEFVALLAA